MTQTVSRASASAGAVTAALGIVYVVWGSTYLGIRIVVEEAPPLTSMGLRFATSGLLLAAVLAWRKGPRSLAIRPKEALGALFLGLSLLLLGNGLVSVAEDRGATSSLTALTIASVPLTIVLFRAAERDFPSARTLLGVLTGFAGLAILLLLGRHGVRTVPLGPLLLVVFAATCWAFGSYVQPRLSLPRDPFVVAVYEMLFGGLLTLLVGLLFGEHLSLDYSARVWTAWIYLVVFGSVVAFSAYVWLVASAPISLVATYAYVNPVIAVFLGRLILDEEVTAATMVGGAVVVASVALVISAERRK